jgi:mutator protein MutT
MTRVAVGVLQRNDKILVCQRKRRSRYGLKWEFPGGKLEPDETIFDCLKRELSEELKIAVDGIDGMETHSASYRDGGNFEVTYCFVSHFTGEPVNKAFEEIRWVTLAELQSLDILEGNKDFVTALNRSRFSRS